MRSRVQLDQMIHHENEFGVFGTKGPRKQKSLVRRVFKVFVLIVLCALVPVAVRGWHFLYANFLERVPPEIEIVELPKGIGTDPFVMKIKVSDEHAGIDEVIVRGEQERDVFVLLKKRFRTSKKTNAVTIEVPFEGRRSKFIQGRAKLKITAFDRSFWNNKREVVRDLQIDYRKPKIHVLTIQHNGVLGGAELVIYRLEEENYAFSGVKVGGGLFPGFPAEKFDPDFKKRPDIYFAFFPIPLTFNPEDEEISLFARDVVGNFATDRIHYHIRKKRYHSKEVELTEAYLREVIDKLIDKYLRLSKRLNPGHSVKRPPAETAEELVNNFRVLNEDFRELVERSLRNIFSRPKISKFWNGAFLRLSKAAQIAPFGEKRRYSFEGLDAGESVHRGIDLASTQEAIVRAANGGVIIFADDLGIYGNTVIIDHGLVL